MSQVPADPRKTLLRYLRVQKLTDAQINALLRRAARDLANQIENIAPTSFADSVKLAQLRIQQRAIAEALWQGTGQATAQGKSRAISSATAGGDADLRELLRGVPAEARQALIDGAERAARDAVERAVARLGGRAVVSLSNRVYRNQQLMAGQVDRMINSALARGLSPREMAVEARRYILPTTPGGVSYSALRLGRTEVNNSFHAASAAYYEDNPFITGMQWKLSGSHPHADICNEYAEENHDRLGAGVFESSNVPPKPHPQCFCYVIPVALDDDEITAAYGAGEFDSFLAGHGVRISH
jgi:hypothetical protein